MKNKVMGLVLVGILSIGMVGCGSNEVEYQEPQVQQEQTVDEYQEKISIMEDLEFYNSLNEELLNIVNESDYSVKEDVQRAYNKFYDILYTLRDYENCYETNELKGYFESAIISELEMLDCIYRTDIYGAEKSMTEFQKYIDMYCQECENLVEKYSGESI